jgi:D-serine deaminase-like pyridoxal phosphate-dependent protein
MSNRYHDYKSALQSLALPQACVDLDLLDQNIHRLWMRSHGKKIRLATKSIRSRFIIDYIFKKNPDYYSGLMCFHFQEAIWWAKEGQQEILVAYPYHRIQIDPSDYPLLSNIIFMIDNNSHVDTLCDLAKLSGQKIQVCLDLDMSTQIGPIYFGVHRSSLKTLQDVSNLLNYLKDKSIEIVAVMGYEAQIAGVADHNPFKKVLNYPIRFLKQMAQTKVFQFRRQACELIHRQGHQLRFVNGGGTGSLEITTRDNSVTELAAGSGYFAPLLFDYYSNFDLVPAAFMALEVTRQSQKGIYTCAGGGYIASGAAGADRLPRPYLPEGIELDINEGAGEVQTPILTDYPLKIGEPVFFRHAKAGELCERFNELVLIRQHQIVDTVKTYRGEGKCFL